MMILWSAALLGLVDGSLTYYLIKTLVAYGFTRNKASWVSSTVAATVAFVASWIIFRNPYALYKPAFLLTESLAWFIALLVLSLYDGGGGWKHWLHKISAALRKLLAKVKEVSGKAKGKVKDKVRGLGPKPISAPSAA